MKLKFLISLIIVMILTGITANATTLPKQVKDYIISQKTVPSIRYDGVIVYNDNVMYLPVFPAYPEEVEQLKIVKTYPENKGLLQFPDMILFNNNFALIKVIRASQNTLTVRNIPNLPVEVKTGMLPQDIMVPRGLVLPDYLAGILGDVQIPLIGSAKSASFITSRKSAPLPMGKKSVDIKKHSIPEALKNKLFFVNNFQTEYLDVFSSTVSEPLYSLKTSGVMKDIKSLPGGKYILAASANKKNIDVVDIENEYISKHIDLTALPTELAVDELNNKVYAASTKDESLSVIDTETMTVKEKIQLAGSPQHLSLSKDGTQLAYIDIKTSRIFVIDLTDEYENKLISTYPNATKLILSDNTLYAISRTQPKLRIINFDLLQDNKTVKSRKQKIKERSQKDEEQKDADNITDDILIGEEVLNPQVEEQDENIQTYSTSIKDINIGNKPIDMYMKDGKIFVLCAGDNSVYSYTLETGSLKTEKLPVDGFSKAFTPVPDSNLAVITNMADLKFVVYDMSKEKAVQTYPISEYINMITIPDKK